MNHFLRKANQRNSKQLVIVDTSSTTYVIWIVLDRAQKRKYLKRSGCIQMFDQYFLSPKSYCYYHSSCLLIYAYRFALIVFSPPLIPSKITTFQWPCLYLVMTSGLDKYKAVRHGKLVRLYYH